MDDLSWINGKAPRFGVQGKNIEVIHEPTEFYDILKEQARRARRRIVLASLYLGSGQLEKELVNTIEHAVENGPSNDKLQVEVLLDYTRGSRGEISSRTMLLPLLNKFSDQVQVSLFHSPDLRGITKKILPERWNEIIGLSHLKVYLFDDNLIMSGANLSESYFTNRQDRYILIKDSPELADFFHQLVKTVSGLSFHLQNDNSVTLASELNSHPYEDNDNGNQFRSVARQKLDRFLDPDWNDSNDKSQNENVDTWVYPVLQMAPFGINNDELLTKAFINSAVPDSTVCLASGYFNLTDDFINCILKNSSANFKIFSASPEANGFFNGSGASKWVPDAYTHISQSFLQKVESSQQQNRITLHEYSRPNWTFHAKGLWHYLAKQTLPYMTIIGSSNFGYRSMYRDLEAQLVIATKNEQLQRQLHEEQERVASFTVPVHEATFLTAARRIPVWVPYVTSIIRKFF